MKNFNCQYLGLCGGCDPHITNEDSLRLDLKTTVEKQNISRESPSVFKDIKWNEVKIHSYDGYGHRNKTDLSYVNGLMGFYNREGQIFSIEHCPHWEPELRDLYLQFQKINFPFSKASFRLRAGANLENGLWIDAAHVELKDFLQNADLLKKLFQIFTNIEVGQKAKRLCPLTYKLQKTSAEHLKTYFSSYNFDRKKQIPFYSFIKSFSQPSVIYNQLILESIHDHISQIAKEIQKPLRVLELGAGCGNVSISLALRSEIQSILALEYDPLSVMSLQKNVEVMALSQKIEVKNFDYHVKSLENKKQFDLIFVNPSRSGLGNFINYVTQKTSKYFIYLSCYPQTFVEDLNVLSSQRYSIKKLEIIDQFPHSNHYESLAFLNSIKF